MPSISAVPMSISVILSYIFDWIVIILIAIAGALFTKINPNHHPFSLADPEISYPYVLNEKVSTVTLALVSLLAPALIIVIVCLIFVPGPTVTKATPRSLIWRRKLWEWNTAWLGLALALAMAFMMTDAMKALFGKPRPDLLNRCMPDLANVQKYIVGGFGNSVADGTYLVSWNICQQPDLEILQDGFAAFPSGHSSFSFAGLTYLTLFLCAKFAITIPYLLPSRYDSNAFASTSLPSKHSELPTTNNSLARHHGLKSLRSQAAAPPVYLLLLAFVPIGTAIYISSTRYSDFKHHGFDIIFGSLMGIVLAWGSFRIYHAPIRRSAGWSWGARSAGRAWFIGVGVPSYAEEKREEEEMVGGMNGTNGVNGQAHALGDMERMV